MMYLDYLLVLLKELELDIMLNEGVVVGFKVGSSLDVSLGLLVGSGIDLLVVAYAGLLVGERIILIRDAISN